MCVAAITKEGRKRRKERRKEREVWIRMEGRIGES